jgi:hypothetical protein
MNRLVDRSGDNCAAVLVGKVGEIGAATYKADAERSSANDQEKNRLAGLSGMPR